MAKTSKRSGYDRETHDTDSTQQLHPTRSARTSINLSPESSLKEVHSLPSESLQLHCNHFNLVQSGTKKVLAQWLFDFFKKHQNRSEKPHVAWKEKDAHVQPKLKSKRKSRCMEVNEELITSEENTSDSEMSRSSQEEQLKDATCTVRWKSKKPRKQVKVSRPTSRYSPLSPRQTARIKLGTKKFKNPCKKCPRTPSNSSSSPDHSTSNSDSESSKSFMCLSMFQIKILNHFH